MVLLDGRGDAYGLVYAVEGEGLAELGAPRGRAPQDLGVGHGGIDDQPVRRDSHEGPVSLVEVFDLGVKVTLELVRVVERNTARGV